MVLDEKISAALDIYNIEAGPTANLLRIFRKFWEIFNINNLTKGRNKRNPVCPPFTDLKLDLDIIRIDFLKNMWRFLSAWEESNNKYGQYMLTSYTFNSFKHSCRSLVAILKYVFEEKNFKYFLTVKLQTDCLEGRFGIYRQTNGGSYHITLNQLISAEKKLRTMSSLKLNKDLIKIDEIENTESGFPNDFFRKIEIDAEKILGFPDNDADFGTLVYVSGYIIAEIDQHIGCKVCIECFQFNENTDEDENFYEYVKSITRNGLKIPSSNFVNLLYRCKIIFEEYILPHVSSKMDLVNRKNLVELFKYFLWDTELCDDFDFCIDHHEKCI